MARWEPIPFPPSYLGELSCTPIWSGEDQVTADHFIRDYLAPALQGEDDPLQIERFTAKCRRLLAANPFTKAGVEMALWDILGKAAELPLYQRGDDPPFEGRGWAWNWMKRKWSAIGFSSFLLLAQQSFYQQALDKYQNKRYEEALPVAEKALGQDRNNPAYFDLYGSILAALDQFYLAEENLRKAVALAPDRPAFEYDLGALLHQERKFAEAVPVLKRAIELDPANLTARLMLARCYVFSYHELQIPNFVELTMEQLNYIVKKNPRFPGVHHHIALVYINSGEPAKAVEELNKELRYDPANTQARLELGETLLKLNQYRKAASELLTAAKQAPQVPGIEFALAKAYKADGETARALEAARKCVELDPQFADGHYLTGQLYRDTGHPDLAKEQFELFRRTQTKSER